MYSFQCCYCKSVTLSYLFMHKENVTKKTPEVLKGQDSGLLQLNLIAALFFLPCASSFACPETCFYIVMITSTWAHSTAHC
jgi:hypothetical protein